MGNINLGRVVLGGLLAGLVLNVGEFLLKGIKRDFLRLVIEDFSLGWFQIHKN